ncbi:MAG: CGNR zinc finger domain-containing protein [Streptosporangiaceae bacterium]
MKLGQDQIEALAECADLINTGRPAAAGRPGSLATTADVIAFGRRHRVENLDAARPADVVRLADLRGRLDVIARACERGDEAVAISGVNALLAETGAVPQIVAHDGRGPHIHVSRPAAPLADRIVAHCAMGLAELVVAGASHRLRSCASPGCEVVFVDLSRNQARRYCDSRTCGNRVHVAAYRARQAARGTQQEEMGAPAATFSSS